MHAASVCEFERLTLHRSWYGRGRGGDELLSWVTLQSCDLRQGGITVRIAVWGGVLGAGRLAWGCQSLALGCMPAFPLSWLAVCSERCSYARLNCSMLLR